MSPSLVFTTTTVTSSSNPVTVLQGLVFTAAVVADSGVAIGLVQFSIDGTPVGSPVALDDAVATLAILLPEGTYEVSADYAGDLTFLASSGSMDPPQFVLAPAQPWAEVRLPDTHVVDVALPATSAIDTTLPDTLEAGANVRKES